MLAWLQVLVCEQGTINIIDSQTCVAVLHIDVSDHSFVVHQSRPVHIRKRRRLELYMEITHVLPVNFISLILNDGNKHNCIKMMKWVI